MTSDFALIGIRVAACISSNCSKCTLLPQWQSSIGGCQSAVTENLNACERARSLNMECQTLDIQAPKFHLGACCLSEALTVTYQRKARGLTNVNDATTIIILNRQTSCKVKTTALFCINICIYLTIHVGLYLFWMIIFFSFFRNEVKFLILLWIFLNTETRCKTSVKFY